MCKKLLFIICVIFILSAVLFGCTVQATKPQEENRVVSISVDESSIPSVAYAGDFDVSVLRINVKYSNGETKSIGVDMDMIETASYSKLQKTGMQFIRIVYAQCITAFNIYLSEKPKSTYILNIKGGKPIKINDVDVDISLDDLKLGNDGIYVYENRFEEGTVVTIEWIEIDKQNFAGWTDRADVNFKDVNSITKATMYANHYYVASGKTAEFYVTFEINCDDNPIPRKKVSILQESDIPTLSREGYVFDGWTTEEVTNGKEVNCDKPKIVFPYEIQFENTVLYATWRDLGLVYDLKDAAYWVIGYSENAKELEIPSKYHSVDVVGITSNALNGATKLEKLTLPSTIREVGDGFVSECGRLKEIAIKGGSNNYFTAIDGVLYNATRYELIAYPAGKPMAVFSFEVNAGSVRKIHNNAFKDALVGGIKLSSVISEIGDSAFDSPHMDYVDFTKVNPNDANLKVGENIFNKNISHIYINENFEDVYVYKYPSFNNNRNSLLPSTAEVTNIGLSDDGILYKEILNTDSDIKVVNTLSIIGVDRSKKDFVVPITLGENRVSVSTIDKDAFYGCINLSSFFVPSESALERILENAFDGTPYYTKLLASDNPAVVFNNVLYKYYGNAATYAVPNVKRIAERAFYGNSTLKILDLKENTNLESIGPYAFYGCVSLKGTANRTVSGAINTDKGFYVKRVLKSIGNYAFAYSAITAFDMQTDCVLQSIGHGAFSNCAYLQKVTIGAQTVDIQKDAFLYCYSLKSFDIDGINDKFLSIDGVLYSASSPEGEINTLFMYPAGRMDTVFDIAQNVKSYSDDINIAFITDYAFFLSNIAALRIPDTVKNISERALYILNPEYIEFESIGTYTYYELFVKDRSDYEKYMPKYIVADLDEDDASLIKFLGNYDDKHIRKYNSAKIVFSEGQDLVLKVVDDGGINKYVSVFRASRQADKIFVSDDYIEDSMTFPISKVEGYAFVGYYLNELTVGANMDALEDNAFSMAMNFNRLVLKAADGKVPDRKEDTFNEKLDNGLFVYVIKKTANMLFTAWNISDKYVIEYESYDELMTEGFPKPVAKFESDEAAESGWLDAEQISEIIRDGIITAEEIQNFTPRRKGYNFEGWYAKDADDDNAGVIDFSNGYVIPYNNVTLLCKWRPASYNIVYVKVQGANLTEETKTIVYGEEYTFPIPTWENGSKNFKSWYTNSGHNGAGYTFDASVPVVWEFADFEDGETIYLYPKWENKKFILIYDLEDYVIESGATQKLVDYEAEFDLDIPVRRGYLFKGWFLNDETNTLVTNAAGHSLHLWMNTAEDSYTVSPVWEAETITVNLYFEEGVPFKSGQKVKFGEEFSFPYTNIGEVEWAQKADIFCGWFSECDVYKNLKSGKGKQFTDADGNGLFKWDSWNEEKEVSLYAQWPIEISSEADFDTCVNDLSEDYLNRAYILKKDNLVFTKRIGSPETPFTGTFIGNNKKITYVYTEPQDGTDGYIGLFAYNKGTIKNLYLDVTVNLNVISKENVYIGAVAAYNEGEIRDVIILNCDITVNSLSGQNSHIGAIAGYNCGKIINTTTSGTDVTAKINVTMLAMSSTFKTYIGGYVGYNKNGIIENISMTLIGLTVNPAAGQEYDKELNDADPRNYYCGIIVGYAESGSIGSSSNSDNTDVHEIVEYNYKTADDPFKGVKYGYSAIAIEIGVTNSPDEVAE